MNSCKKTTICIVVVFLLILFTGLDAIKQKGSYAQVMLTTCYTAPLVCTLTSK